MDKFQAYRQGFIDGFDAAIKTLEFNTPKMSKEDPVPVDQSIECRVCGIHFNIAIGEFPKKCGNVACEFLG